MSETVAGRQLESLENDRSFFGHPKGLFILFFAEMWERFSFYGMRSLLVLYLVQHFLFEPGKAQGLYAAYGSLVYLTPIVGGMIADRYLGPRRAVMIGAIFLTAGHGLMAFEGSGSTAYLETDNGRYEVVVEGRGDETSSFLKEADGTLRPMRFSEEGIEVGGTGQAASFLTSDDYEQVVEQEEMYVNILFMALSLIVVGVGFFESKYLDDRWSALR